MIANLKPYPAMKDSGVPWLGNVPEHWEMRRGKWLFRHRKQINFDHSDSNVLSLTLRGVVNNDPDNPEGLVPNDYATYQLFRKGDLVFKLIDLENLRTSRVGLVHEDGIMSSAYVRLTPQKVIDMRFFFQQYSDLYQRGIYNQLGAGVRSTLGPTDLLNLSVVVPPLSEQTAIVRFLNYMDRRIRKYIRTKQKLIKLLEEQKHVIIHRTVTTGLDPNVSLKPSGMEWLGEVPLHWEAVRVKHCARRISKGTTPSTEGRELLDSGPVRFLKVENIVDGRITDKPLCFIDEKTNKLLRRSQLKEGDVLFVIAGATLGKTTVVQQYFLPANTNQAVAFVRPNERVLPAYLALWLQSPRVKEMVWLNAVQSAQPNLSMADLGNFSFPLPPKEEQEQALVWLNAKLRNVTTTIEHANREIALLHEYRTRLIADVVTGKLNVRDVELPISDEAEALEGTDDAIEADIEEIIDSEEGADGDE